MQEPEWLCVSRRQRLLSVQRLWTNQSSRSPRQRCVRVREGLWTAAELPGHRESIGVGGRIGCGFRFEVSVRTEIAKCAKSRHAFERNVRK